ncbi:MAG TPA: acetylornithine deacetylase [Acetobacteraceae bacterium]|nr:acetylornithine deacetylase [Acetobacteraceae bacterium]
MTRMHIAPSSSTEMLARLIAFDTTSHNSNLDLIGFVRGWLDAHGVPYRLSFDPTGRKANLHATIGPLQSGGLAFSGHLDTVSADGQAWTGDPFTLRRENGRLIGRGACDMKGFVAATLAAVPDIKARKPARPVHLLLTYDEEVGYHGARRLIEDIAESGLRPAACVVGEASGMLPIMAQKGRLIARVGVRGHAAHSSEAHRGVNAVHAVAEAIAFLAAASRGLARNGPTEAGFDPPYSTLQVSNLTCGVLPNTVPDRAGFDVEWRNIPADNPMRELARFKAHVATAIEPRMRAQHPDTGFDYEVLLDLAAFSMPPEHELARAACDITGTPAGGKVSYCSEGSLFQPTGIACMVCGPGHLAQVHQPDEWIAESQLAICDGFLRSLVDRMAA